MGTAVADTKLKNLLAGASKETFLKDHLRADSGNYRHPIHDEGGSVVGFFTPRTGEDGAVRVGAIYVDPAHRGKGLAAKAVQAYVADKPARAFINTDNAASRRMFESAGFRQDDPEERWGGGHWFRNEAEMAAKRLRDANEAQMTSVQKLAARLKNPEGGLTAAGRRHYAKTEGANLKPGVKNVDEAGDSEKKRWARWAVRFYSNPRGPMTNDKGEPTRLALMANAWGTKVPKTREEAQSIAARGRKILESAKGSEKKSYYMGEHMALAELGL